MPPLTPMGTLRWHVVEPLVDHVAPRTVLEIGCGQGAVATRLSRRAQVTAVELDESSHAVSAARLEGAAEVVHGAVDTLAPGRQWDLVCAFEVLEHIEDDDAALDAWFAMVRPGGHLLLSVPVHQRRFGPADELVGHYRRYDRGQLGEKLHTAGFVDVSERLYGWPLGYALEQVRNAVSARRLARGGSTGESLTKEDRTMTSGRFLQPSAVIGTAMPVVVRPFAWLQMLFPSRGTGAVVLARRRQAS